MRFVNALGCAMDSRSVNDKLLRSADRAEAAKPPVANHVRRRLGRRRQAELAGISDLLGEPPYTPVVLVALGILRCKVYEGMTSPMVGWSSMFAERQGMA